MYRKDTDLDDSAYNRDDAKDDQSSNVLSLSAKQVCKSSSNEQSTANVSTIHYLSSASGLTIHKPKSKPRRPIELPARIYRDSARSRGSSKSLKRMRRSTKVSSRMTSIAIDGSIDLHQGSRSTASPKPPRTFGPLKVPAHLDLHALLHPLSLILSHHYLHSLQS